MINEDEKLAKRAKLKKINKYLRENEWRMSVRDKIIVNASITYINFIQKK